VSDLGQSVSRPSVRLGSPTFDALEYNLNAWREMYADGRLSLNDLERYVENAIRNHDAGLSPSGEPTETPSRGQDA
jgi:hypothetical protein